MYTYTKDSMSSAHKLASKVTAPVRSAYSTGGVRGAMGSVKKPAMIGAGLFAGATMISRRRSSGLDKTVGRPTGIYNQ